MAQKKKMLKKQIVKEFDEALPAEDFADANSGSTTTKTFTLDKMSNLDYYGYNGADEGSSIAYGVEIAGKEYNVIANADFSDIYFELVIDTDDAMMSDFCNAEINNGSGTVYLPPSENDNGDLFNVTVKGNSITVSKDIQTEITMEEDMDIFENAQLTPAFKKKLKQLIECKVAEKVASMKLENDEEEELEEAAPVANTSGDDIAALTKDTDVRKILMALGANPTLFQRSLAAADKDIAGNSVADDSFGILMKILKVISNDPVVAQRIAATLRKDKDAPAVEPAADEDMEVAEESMDVELEEFKESVIVNVDRYLTHAAEEWLTENKLAVETGLRVENSEQLLSAIRNVLLEHGLEIPEETSVVAKLQESVSTLEEKLNKKIEESINLKKSLNESKRIIAINESTEGMTLSQVEKLKTLCEDVEYTDDKTFKNKIEKYKTTILEGKTTSMKTVPSVKKKTVVTEQVEQNGIVDDIDTMDKYAAAIEHNLRSADY